MKTKQEEQNKIPKGKTKELKSNRKRAQENGRTKGRTKGKQSEEMNTKGEIKPTNIKRKNKKGFQKGE